MSKQEGIFKIRWGIDLTLEEQLEVVYRAGKWGADSILTIGNAKRKIKEGLHSQGVVIKVECPKCRGHARPNKVTYNSHEGYCVNGHSCPNCNNTGYVATGPLIEEG